MLGLFLSEMACDDRNHKEKLDPALIRPGRADFHREIGNATREQVDLQGEMI